jgi:wyosine [tRNA(Phe)-imidazoG37] synthetase (radical SAM superfamily)
MKYIEVSGEIDSDNQLILHELLNQIKPQRVEIDIVFRDEEEDYRESTKAEILEGIRESLHEYSRGECRPVAELWDNIMIQSTGEIDEVGQLIIDEPLKKIESQYVDVVIRFMKDEKSNQESDRHGYKALVKELSGSRM